MSSPGQKRGSCGHAMAIFDGHAFCARCREKGKGEEPCVKDKDSVDCTLCNSFTPEQRAQISTPSYKIKKEKRDAKRAESSQASEELVDPTSVSVIGVVSGPSADKSPPPPEKKVKKEKLPAKSKKLSSTTPSSTTEEKFTALEDKWAERFNRLEALLVAKSIEPSFSSDVRVVPSHSPPATVTRDSEPFFQPANSSVDPQRTDPDSGAVSQLSAGKLTKDSSLHRSSSSERTGPDKVASQQKSAGKLRSMSTSEKVNYIVKGALVQTTLLRSISRPVSLVLMFTDRLMSLLEALSSRSPAFTPPTDLLPTLPLQPFRRAGRIVFPAWIQTLTVKSLIPLRLNSLQRRLNSPTTKILNKNFQHLKSRRIEKL